MYTGWLLPAAVVGLLVFMYGVITINQNTPANEICDSRGEFIMCPLCNERLGCAFWDLNDICFNTRISYLFDHPGTVFYSIFVSFWGESGVCVCVSCISVHNLTSTYSLLPSSPAYSSSPFSRVLPGVLEEKERLLSSPLGLPRLPGGGGAAPPGVRSQGPVQGEEPNHGREGAVLPQIHQD